MLAWLLSFHKTLSGWIAGIGGAVGSLMTLAAGTAVLLSGQTANAMIPIARHTVQLHAAERHLAGDFWSVQGVYQPVQY